MLHIAGEERFGRAASDVRQSLMRPAFLCECFPGVDRVVHSDDRSASLVVRPGFSFVRGTMEVSFEIMDVRPDGATVMIHIKGIGSSAELEALFRVQAGDCETTVGWEASARQVGGLLKAVSQGLLQAAAQKVAAETWANIRARLQA